MFSTIKAIYKKAGQLPWQAPWLFLIPVLGELIQHIAELQIGMYASVEAARAMGDDPIRLFFGLIKTLSILIISVLAARFWYFNNMQQTFTINRKTLLFISVLLTVLITSDASTLFILPHLLADDSSSLIGLVFIVLNLILTITYIYLLLWLVDNIISNHKITVKQSIQKMHGAVIKNIILVLIAPLPIIAMHIGLGGYFVLLGFSYPVIIMLLVIDSIIVGFLGAVMAATNYVIYEKRLEETSENAS